MKNVAARREAARARVVAGAISAVGVMVLAACGRSKQEDADAKARTVAAASNGNVTTDRTDSGAPAAVARILIPGRDSAEDGQWLRPAKDFASTRFSGLDQITSANASKLALAWSFSTGVLRGQEAAPLVVGGTMYVVTPYPNILYALDLVLADMLETLIFAVMVQRDAGPTRYFPGIAEDAFYGYFMVATWIPCFVTVYLVPRWV